MNKFDRQSSSGDAQMLPDDIAEELSRLPVEVISVSDAPSLAPPAPLSQDEVRTIVISLMLTMFLAALDQTIVATALPTIGRQFNDVSNLSWVITAYLLASTAVAPVFGTLSDIYGRRVMITVSLVLFTAGSILCAVHPVGWWPVRQAACRGGSPARGAGGSAARGAGGPPGRAPNARRPGHPSGPARFRLLRMQHRL